MKAEEFTRDYFENNSNIKLLDRELVGNDYWYEIIEAYHQSRVNAVSDEYRKNINKNHAMTDEVKHQRTQASLYIQNKLLKK